MSKSEDESSMDEGEVIFGDDTIGAEETVASTSQERRVGINRAPSNYAYYHNKKYVDMFIIDFLWRGTKSVKFKLQSSKDNPRRRLVFRHL
jgi:hypothetical protein